MPKEGINTETFGWLTNCPPGDQNFKGHLKEANEATVRAAITDVKSRPAGGNKTLLKLLESRLEAIISDSETATKDVLIRANQNLALATGELLEEQHALEAQQAEQADREKRIADAYEVAGRIQALSFVEKVTTVGSLMQLKQIKESKTYKDLPNIGTWDKFCDYLGFSRQKVDEDLANLATFGEAFLQTVGSFSLGYRELKKLRQLTNDGAVQLDEGTITIEGETIPIDADHAPEVEAAVSALLEKHKTIAARVEKLEKNLDAVVKEENKSWRNEKKLYEKELDRLKAFDPGEHDETWCEEQMQVIHEDCKTFSASIAKFIVDPRLEGDRAAQAQVLRYMNQAEAELFDLRKQFESAYTSGE
ncbi:MAG: hypothetical protein M0T70_02765 [Geobacteraceae bacterium]|nr:hypothetical protein [Geobacteraceae bacterium]